MNAVNLTDTYGLKSAYVELKHAAHCRWHKPPEDLKSYRGIHNMEHELEYKEVLG